MNFTAPQAVQIDSAYRTGFDWLWRVTWHQRTGYGAVYKMKEDSDNMDLSILKLVKTTIGIDYQLLTFINIGGRPSEATIRLMPDGEMLILIRREEKHRKA